MMFYKNALALRGNCWKRASIRRDNNEKGEEGGSVADAFLKKEEKMSIGCVFLFLQFH